ncbi:MAG: AAA family ATPase [Bdellovibrionota bacterium]
MSSTVINALLLALEANPADVEMRIHVASLLVDAGQFEQALEHFQTLLKSSPCDIPALAGAARAAEGLGQRALAENYSRLLSALDPKRNGEQTKSSETTQAFSENDPLDESADVENVNDESDVSTDEARAPTHLRVVGGKDYDPELHGVSEERPTTTLADVGGLESVKKRLNISFLAPLRNPELRKQYGLTLRGGLLLYGPPGCGKTFIARALAGELKAKFYSIGLSDVLDMWYGESERKLHELFETVRRNKPACLFFDEIDAIGHKRGNLRGNAGRNLVNALLMELDGVNADNDGLFILAATNHPWDVDEALRRPGRFDRSVLVLPPDEPARAAILSHHLKSYPADAIASTTLAKKTVEFSGADLKQLCKEAAESAVEESLETGKVRPLEMKDFESVLKTLRSSTRPWFVTAKNYAMFANEGGQYDDLLEYIKKQKY